MENSNFETMEKKRFSVMLLRTISFTCWYLGMILIQLSLNSILMAIISILTALFAMLFVYAYLKSFKLFKKINQDPVLKQALINEMYLSFDKKALATGLSSVMAFAMILFFLSDYVDISVKIISMLIIYIGVVSTEIHRLFLYK